MSGQLIVVRHAPTDAAGRCVGRARVKTLLDPAAAAGRVAALLAARRPTLIWSSPAPRCAAPAAVLAACFGLPHRVDEDLWEVDFGGWTGRSWDDIQRRDGERLASWMADYVHRAPPGGESADALAERVGRFCKRLPGHERSLLVGHAGVARALRVLLGQQTWDEAMARPVPFLEVDAVYPVCPLRCE